MKEFGAPGSGATTGTCVVADHGTERSDVRVTDLSELTTGQKGYWREFYDHRGTRVQQSPAYAEAVRRAGRQVLCAVGCGVVAVFTRDGSTCTALCSDLPFLSTGRPDHAQLVSVVSAVRRVTDLSVYLPLVDASYAGVHRHEEFSTWDRLPNSLIDWSSDGADLWQRALSRGTSQILRKRRLVERDGLELVAGRPEAKAARDMLHIDDRSWKAAHGQSMRQRAGQWALYSRLVEDGTLTAAFLRDGERPVAFRLDGRVRDRVTCLKWSYDESYRRYSPGLYLLTEGLTRQWGGQGVRTVDLFGSPDALKDLLYSERPGRIDVWCGDARLAARRADERIALDTRVTQAREEGKGLRHAFG